MVQLYQLKFHGYACSQCLLLCFSVAQCHQEAAPTVNIDGHDDYHVYVADYCKHASPPHSQLCIHSEYSSCIRLIFVVTPVTSTFCRVLVSLNATKKRYQQSISMVTTTIMCM